MLKIKRCPGEGLTIITSNSSIHIELDIKSGKQVCFSIEASDGIKMWRDELFEENN